MVARCCKLLTQHLHQQYHQINGLLDIFVLVMHDAEQSQGGSHTLMQEPVNLAE